MPNYWLTITSPNNLVIDHEKGIQFTGFSERFRNTVSRIRPGDRLVIYATGFSAFWAIAEITGPMYEDSSPVWEDPRDTGENYPLRFPIKHLHVLPLDKLLVVGPLVPRLTFIPARLKPNRFGAAFRASLRQLPPEDFELIESEMRARETTDPVQISATEQAVSAGLKKRFFGPPLNFRELRHEPINEQGVVYLFGMVARELGFLVEGVATEFPDCSAKRLRGQDRYEVVSIEFEYRASNFRQHKHDVSGCDLIVCWLNDWPNSPLEVIELKEAIKKLPS